MKSFRVLCAAVCLLASIQPVMAQRFPRSISLSDRVGDTIDKHEQAYFGLFPRSHNFSGARVTQVSNAAYQIIITSAGQQEVIDLDIPQFQALQAYIDGFETRYTGKRAENWDYITAYTSPIHEPFGPAETYEFTLITGKKRYGKIVWADEGGVYYSGQVSATNHSLTGARLNYLPRGRLFRLAEETSLLKSFQDKLDILYAGEPGTYATLTLPRLKAAALHPRSMPPELNAMVTRENIVSTQPLADPDWNIFRVLPQQAKFHFVFYGAPLNYITPGTINPTETDIAQLEDAFAIPAQTVSTDLATRRPLLFMATRYSITPLLRLGISVSQTATNNFEPIENVSVTGAGMDWRTRLVRNEAGIVRVGGTFVSLDFTYLLKAGKDYIQLYPRRTRKLSGFDIKVTAGPSIGFTRSDTQIRSIGTVRLETGRTLINAIYGTIDSDKSILPGGHAGIEFSSFLNGSWSVGLLMDAAIYFNYKVPTRILTNLAGETVKTVDGPSNNLLMLPAVYFGIAYHL